MTSLSTPLYDQFVLQYRARRRLSSSMGLLSWDTQILMPPMARQARSEQSSALASLMHSRSCDPAWGKLLQECLQKEASQLTPAQRFNVSEALRGFEESTKIPAHLIEESAGLNAKGIALWSEARAKNDYSIFEPVLQKWVDLQKEIGRILKPELKPYDACLDTYEKGMHLHVISPIFEELKAELPRLFNQIMLTPQPKSLPSGPYPISSQKHLARFLALRMGFDFQRGRMDDAPHPFTLALNPDDVRISSRWDEHSFFSGVKSLVHETGHGLYEQGLRQDEHAQLPAAHTLGMVVHESQSLFWERMIFKSREFFDWFGPILQSHFPDLLHDWEPEEIWASTCKVSPTPIRIDADEVTYPLHIIIRMELEQALFSDQITTADIPTEWNRKTMEYLGFEPENLKTGCLQDLHWADGSFGYFPSYSLGAIAAAQLWDTLIQELPEIPKEIQRGKFRNTLSWLQKKVHTQGRLQSAPELLKSICQEGLSAKPFLNHLRKRYLGE